MTPFPLCPPLERKAVTHSAARHVSSMISAGNVEICNKKLGFHCSITYCHQVVYYPKTWLHCVLFVNSFTHSTKLTRQVRSLIFYKSCYPLVIKSLPCVRLCYVVPSMIHLTIPPKNLLFCDVDDHTDHTERSCPPQHQNQQLDLMLLLISVTAFCIHRCNTGISDVPANTSNKLFTSSNTNITNVRRRSWQMLDQQQ